MKKVHKKYKANIEPLVNMLGLDSKSSSIRGTLIPVCSALVRSVSPRNNSDIIVKEFAKFNDVMRKYFSGYVNEKHSEELRGKIYLLRETYQDNYVKCTRLLGEIKRTRDILDCINGEFIFRDNHKLDFKVDLITDGRSCKGLPLEEKTFKSLYECYKTYDRKMRKLVKTLLRYVREMNNCRGVVLVLISRFLNEKQENKIEKKVNIKEDREKIKLHYTINVRKEKHFDKIDVDVLNVKICHPLTLNKEECIYYIKNKFNSIKYLLANKSSDGNIDFITSVNEYLKSVDSEVSSIAEKNTMADQITRSVLGSNILSSLRSGMMSEGEGILEYSNPKAKVNSFCFYFTIEL